MKFRDGAWLWTDGVKAACMKRVHEYRIDGDALVLAAVDRSGNKGEDRFEGTVLQVRVTCPMADVIRVQVRHHHPVEAGVTGFDLDESLQSANARIEDRGDDLVVNSGRLSLYLRKSGDWSMSFRDGEAAVAEGAGESLGYMTVNGHGGFLMQRLSLGVGECIYGLGERFGPLVKNGQNVVIWNQDGGTASDQAYKNVPFYLSSRGYGLLVNSPGKVDFEIGTERVSQVQFSVPGEVLDYYLIYGPDPKDVLEKYTRLSGRPAVPPAWSFGLWLSTSFTTRYDEKTVNEFVDGMAARDIPLKVFHFDCFWMKQRHWCDFEWDRDAFPDPVGMLRRLKDKGLKICLWINPYISQLSRLFDEGRRGGCFLKRPDGSVYQRDQWQPGMALVDFTNPQSVRWYQSKLRALLEMGVDCFKTDFGERIPHDVVYHDGSDARLMHNYYAYLYTRSVFELLEEHHGKGNAIVFARAATAGCQKFPVHWGGDCDATFESMAEDLRGGLSFCMSGAAFWSHDIGGFNGTANAALYKRWIAFGLLSTHSRLHGSGSYRVPWLFDDESVDVMRHFAKLKNRLFPYLFAAAHDATENGWPVLRAMVLEYPNDPGCRYLDRQYMLGDALLVAPVFHADNLAEFYLPDGKWTDLLTNEVLIGGRWLRRRVSFMQVPLFVRENSIVAMSSNESEPAWMLNDELTLHLFRIADGAELAVNIHSSDGVSSSAFTCHRQNGDYVLSCDGKATNVRVLFREWSRAAGMIVNGSILEETSQGVLVKWIDPSKPLEVRAPSKLTPHIEHLPAANRDKLRA
jgi:alpha-D-xyloside xylohydrolase